MTALREPAGTAARPLSPPAPSRGPRVLVVLQGGSRGAAALTQAARLTDNGGELTVLTLAPPPPGIRCGPSGDALAEAIISAAERDLDRARGLLGHDRPSTTYETLPGATERALARRIEAGSHDLVVLPRRRLPAGHRRAGRLRRLSRTPVHLV